jgi:hypothetical protein
VVVSPQGRVTSTVSVFIDFTVTVSLPLGTVIPGCVTVSVAVAVTIVVTPG